MKQVDKITIEELWAMAEKMYGTLVKADVDVALKKVVVDMEMHDNLIEFDSMINKRPRQNNTSRDVLDPKVHKRITQIIAEVVYA